MGNFFPAGQNAVGKAGFWANAPKAAPAPAGTWTVRPAYPLTAVAALVGSATRMVALDGAGATAHSDDGGATWALGSGFTATNAGVTLAVNNTGSLWVAVCGNGVTLTSADGATWSVSGTIAPIFGAPTIVYGGGLFMVGTASSAQNVDCYTSPDGITWTPQGSATPNQLAPLLYDGTRFIAAARDAANLNPVIATTADGGATWTQVVVNQTINGMAFHAGEYVAAMFTLVQSATDATTWTPPTTLVQPLTDSADGVAFANGLWCLVGDATGGTVPQAATSTDLATWTLEDMDLSPTDYQQVANMAFAGGKFVAWTFTGRITTRN